MKPFLILLVLALPFASHAFAYTVTSKDACTPIDFRETFPLKMRDQGTISWCFAHAASDYLQFTYAIPEQISAADVAINYYKAGVPSVVNFFKRIFNQEARIEPPQTGFIAIAINRIRKEGFCPESVFPSETWTKVDTITGKHSEIGLLPAIEQMWDLQKQVQSGQVATANDLPWFLSLKNLDQSSFYALLKNTKKAKLLDGLRTTVCNGSRRPFPTNPLASRFDLNGKHFFEKMNANFDKGMPTTIDFFSGVLENYNQYAKSLAKLHTALIYGRKFDETTQQCTYLLKNSHGPDCSKYAPEIKCESGYLWFPESKMNEMMFSRLILERQ